jgi:serine/threonine-protein kinase
MARIEHDVRLGGRYRLVQRIATGGMGTVWRAEDTLLGRPVAVKLLSDALGQDGRFVERFRREARAAGGLSHPNVARVYDYGEDDGRPFIVMELLEGETLAARLHRVGRLRPDEAAEIGGQVARALHSAHQAGIVHRDVKPGNVMLTPHSGAKVMDFGIAAAAWASPLTATGTTMGTASYLSPEQASGERATAASDVYALGCVLYEMLTGRPPFDADSPIAVASAHMTDRPTPIRDLAPDVPAWMASAVAMAMAKDPAARPPSARVFAEMLERNAPGLPAAATPPLGFQRPQRPPRGRSRAGWLWVLAATAVLALTFVIAFRALSGGIDSPPTPPPGQKASPTAQALTVPPVIGLRVTDALARLTQAGLVPVPRQVKGPAGVVVKVDPGVGSPVQAGDSVTVYVGSGHHHGKGNDHGDGGGND